MPATKQQTARMLARMLKENTGAALCDSGGVYGRNWEANQKRQFSKEQEARFSVNAHGIEMSLNNYHWLLERLEYAPDMQRRLRNYARRNEEEWGLGLMESFTKHLKDTCGATGLYGDGDPMTVNSYNGSCLLEQTIQFVMFNVDDTDYVLLQIHGGCDVRGGYTDPVAFRITDDPAVIFDYARASIQCEKDADHYWQTDDAFSWYYQGGTGHTMLQEYDRAEVQNGVPHNMLARRVAERLAEKSGTILYTKEGKAFCPICGGELRAGT